MLTTRRRIRTPAAQRLKRERRGTYLTTCNKLALKIRFGKVKIALTTKTKNTQKNNIVVGDGGGKKP